ncbi:uncharacterized protein [Coffea arabica]|uniref:Uncharacterized protein n=1 Tax=Coffea arabica TaxID=13443 RepID=A0ABM4UHF5_COFAR
MAESLSKSVRSRGGRGGQGTCECTHCGLKNHNRDTCWDLVGKPPRFANAVIIDKAESSSSAQGSQKTLTTSEEDYVKFLQYQVTNHVSLPSVSLAQKGDDSWIMDFGATDHMSGFEDKENDWWRA